MMPSIFRTKEELLWTVTDSHCPIHLFLRKKTESTKGFQSRTCSETLHRGYLAARNLDTLWCIYIYSIYTYIHRIIRLFKTISYSCKYNMHYIFSYARTFFVTSFRGHFDQKEKAATYDMLVCEVTSFLLCYVTFLWVWVPPMGLGYRFRATFLTCYLWGLDCDCLFLMRVKECHERVVEGWGVSRKRSLSIYKKVT